MAVMSVIHRKLEIPLRDPVDSLSWRGDSLIDWVGGGRVFHLDGTVVESHIIWGYRFDAAVQSISGRYAAIYERLGTKAVLLDSGELLRELNRSFYFADSYEYPLVFFQHPDGRELLAHCPEEYNRIEIEEVATGSRLTASDSREPEDCFYSRLAVSSDGNYLLACGWLWHPFDTATVWPIADALMDGRTLDPLRSLYPTTHAEINSASFVDTDRVIISSHPNAVAFRQREESSFGPGHVGVFNLKTNSFESVTKIAQSTGDMMWIGDGRVVCFYETPSVIDLATGDIVESWPDIFSGKRDGNIIHSVGELPPLAIDPIRKRFAVASHDRITVIDFGSA